MNTTSFQAFEEFHFMYYYSLPKTQTHCWNPFDGANLGITSPAITSIQHEPSRSKTSLHQLARVILNSDFLHSNACYNFQPISMSSQNYQGKRGQERVRVRATEMEIRSRDQEVDGKSHLPITSENFPLSYTGD